MKRSVRVPIWAVVLVVMCCVCSIGLHVYCAPFLLGVFASHDTCDFEDAYVFDCKDGNTVAMVWRAHDLISRVGKDAVMYVPVPYDRGAQSFHFAIESVHDDGTLCVTPVQVDGVTVQFVQSGSVIAKR